MSTSFNATEETVREEIVDGALLLAICRPHAGNSIDTPTVMQLDPGAYAGTVAAVPCAR